MGSERHRTSLVKHQSWSSGFAPVDVRDHLIEWAYDHGMPHAPKVLAKDVGIEMDIVLEIDASAAVGIVSRKGLGKMRDPY